MSRTLLVGKAFRACSSGSPIPQQASPFNAELPVKPDDSLQPCIVLHLLLLG